MPQANWNEKQKTILLEILVELKKSGDIGQDNSIKKAAWTTILQQFNFQAGVAYDKAQLQTCLQNQKKKYEAFMKMKNTSGLGWDHDMELPLCEDAEWNTYVMYNKDAKEFRHKTLANFDLLDEYFSGTIATGEYASASGRLGHKPNAYSANAVAKDIEDDSSAEDNVIRMT